MKFLRQNVCICEKISIDFESNPGNFEKDTCVCGLLKIPAHNLFLILHLMRALVWWHVGQHLIKILIRVYIKIDYNNRIFSEKVTNPKRFCF